MRLITRGCTTRRAWSTLLRDNLLAGLAASGRAASSLAISADGCGCGASTTAGAICGRRSDRSGVGTAVTASTGAIGAGGGSSADIAGSAKLVAGSTGRSTSAT